MVDTKDKVIVSLIILLLTASGVTLSQLNDDGNWYYCEVENSLKQCDSLAKYGIPDAKCILDGKGDICTSGGVRQAWNSLSNYDTEVGKKGPTVAAIQDCNVVITEKTTQVPVTRMVDETIYTPYDCYDPENQTQTTCFTESIESVKKTFMEDVTEEVETTVCKNKGFNVIYSDKLQYEITGECCGYFSEENNPYKFYSGEAVISCSQIQNGVCNPVLQQTSNDAEVFDETGRIYVINKKAIKQTMTDKYEYVIDQDIKISEMKQK